MNDQDQRLAASATGLQAGRDNNIVIGISPEQMSEIMLTVARTTSLYAREALAIAEDRMEQFRLEVLKQFADPKKADPEAFRDPDFVRVVGDAQEAVARSGEEVVRDTLVDIIARRSLEKTRTRLSITLGEAAAVAGKLTENEFAALSLVYVMRYTLYRGITNLAGLGEYIQTNLVPIARLVSREQSSFWHLQAQSCASVQMGKTPLMQILKTNFGGVLGKGFTSEELESSLPYIDKQKLAPLLIPCVNDASKLQPNGISFDHFKENADASSVSEDDLKRVWRLFEGSIGDAPELLASVAPDIAFLIDLWDNSELKQLLLTSIGVAIGHANAVRMIGVDAPLNIWIK